MAHALQGSAPPSSEAVDAARHLCQEARVVLTSLRGGPPNVARGELAQDLMELRKLVQESLDQYVKAPTTNSNAAFPRRPQEAAAQSNNENPAWMAGRFAYPFLAVVMDPRAAGPHTLIALRALYRLLERGSLQPAAPVFAVALEPLTKGVLSCKFEQTDAGADEAVEMAIADLLALLVRLDRSAIRTETLMDAFNTVFITRNTFVHSPALCYHFEDVLASMVAAVFAPLPSSAASFALDDPQACGMLDFLVSQLLHITPLTAGSSVGGDDEATRDAQLAHDATRVLCLRLARYALQFAFRDVDDYQLHLLVSSQKSSGGDPDPYSAGAELVGDEATGENELSTAQKPTASSVTVLQIIQEDLCLALLTTGQSIWASHEKGASVGFVSLEVLSEICSTLSTIWSTTCLRAYLVPQLEAIFTGFYQRALVLLRKRMHPTDSMSFHANVVFDAGMEVILESLVDIVGLHDHRFNVSSDGNGGAIESLFLTYDCSTKRSDVAVGLMKELCYCTGSQVDEEGDALELSIHGDAQVPSRDRLGSKTKSAPETRTATTPEESEGGNVPSSHSSPSLNAPEESDVRESAESAHAAFRPVPPHLKELCAEAIISAMRCLFRDDHASDETRRERQQRHTTILPDHLTGSAAPASLSHLSDLNALQQSSAGLDANPGLDAPPLHHRLQTVKSQKRLLRKAAQLFNKKSSHGIEFLANSGLVPDPVTPRSVASFLRNGIVVGLDKRAVGAYLGEVGKKPQSGKSPPNWERDWFHKEVLEIYCGLFRFERQSVLDGLRMFLAAFRLPGEAQQIDRILQAFADACVQVCHERSQGLFSDDPKKASDAAYLLSFSIIMLNTDRHNDNIREDRKMSKKDFVKNNTDYGRDITEPGKEFPREYLEGIFNSIREEEIRTEGEGAEGSMTVERWKDVLRGSSEEDGESSVAVTHEDADDLTELVLEHVWMPIMSAIAALWGVSRYDEARTPSPTDAGGMHGAQGSRLGMDMALEMLMGVRQLGRKDVFQKIFNCVCKYTGLLEYSSNIAGRTWAFTNSVEAQSAVVVSVRVAKEAGNEIGVSGWKRIWAIVFELRDLKALGGGSADRIHSILLESDQDLLRDTARRDRALVLLKGGKDESISGSARPRGVSSIFGTVGRALFGSVEDPSNLEDPADDPSDRSEVERTIHGKEELFLWNDLAPSDDEDETDVSGVDKSQTDPIFQGQSIGSQFETQLIHEDLIVQRSREMTVTGLERVEDNSRTALSPRARVRKRLTRLCDFASLVADSRFVDEDGLGSMLQALIELIAHHNPDAGLYESDAVMVESPKDEIRQSPVPDLPLSPASEAFAEVLICELAIRNRDRLKMIWESWLLDHYSSRLQIVAKPFAENEKISLRQQAVAEKCLTGLLRISYCAVQRPGVANSVLALWTVVDPGNQAAGKRLALLESFDKIVGEGLWRIARNIDERSQLDDAGWRGLMALSRWGSHRGSVLPPVRSSEIGRSVGLADDDISLQVYRAIHFMLNASEAKHNLPPAMIGCIRTLVATGDRRHCPKLSIAALDLLLAMNNEIEHTASTVPKDAQDSFWSVYWYPVLEGMAEGAEFCNYPSVRHHALSMLTDAFLDNSGGLVPAPHLSKALGSICIPVTGRRIVTLMRNTAVIENFDELMMELDLCVGLIFKPLRHHLKIILGEDQVSVESLWKAVLVVLKQILVPQKPGDENEEVFVSQKVVKAVTDLTIDHVRNVVMVMASLGVLHAEPETPDDLSAITWECFDGIEACKGHVNDWRQAAFT